MGPGRVRVFDATTRKGGVKLRTSVPQLADRWELRCSFIFPRIICSLPAPNTDTISSVCLQGLAMTTKRLNEALGKIKGGLAMLEEMDPNVEQSSTATRKAMDALFCYTVMQKEFSKKKRQTTMLQFFKKTRVEDVVPEEDVDDPVEAVEAEEAQVDDDILDSEVDSDGECLTILLKIIEQQTFFLLHVHPNTEFVISLLATSTLMLMVMTQECGAFINGFMGEMTFDLCK
ncbi:hypothetical protein E2C01_040478 [Portunus trituberculatus]|uniref:Uncharacterized protein n=1 Tax=Portunus trituberculatus TaxID=210409 RepID=A0A5B7FJT7_PORTR|nr:hypothetical protein [Portunus trituberculatus]